ncbi:MAG: FAD-dependent oxidoreductase [Candidatus Sumerlaeia bacterium]|nr:FAD-dependent oxidoreductase [Candidatus Sumerlaeia bacterium]
MSAPSIRADVVVFGGGIAGLWTLEALVRAGYGAVLLEAASLGAGQTIWSQGIIHGGAKYTLRGLSDRLAHVTRVIADMPRVWSEALAGRGPGPDLSRTLLLAPHCHLWRTGGMASWAGIRAAGQVLKTPVVELPRAEWPAALAGVPGEVYRLDEQVVSPHSLVADFATQHSGRCLRIAPSPLANATAEASGVRFAATLPDGSELVVEAARVVLCAGAGNAALRGAFGLDPRRQQIRPLKMAMVRGPGLTALRGHCVDGAKTRVTITSDTDSQGRTVWQVGGQIAEDAPGMDEAALRARVVEELRATIPGVDLAGLEVAFYEANRAEEATEQGFRPDDASVLAEGPVLTVWPTKLALAPRAAELVLERLAAPPTGRCELPANAPRPDVCPPPWETAAWTPA